MIPWWALLLLMVGASLTIGGVLGCCRLGDELVARRSGGRRGPGREGVLSVADVAVLMAAHNEEAVIADSLRAITALVPPGNVHVVSDGSTDATVALAEQAGVHVIATARNVGKAGALAEAIRRFDLVARYAVVMLLDADTRVQPGYFDAGLPCFDDPDVVAVAGCVRTAEIPGLSVMGNILVGHRQKIYTLGQRLLKYGQTWSKVNATYIVPGFASMYRASVLPYIDMDPPGLVIEDFNMTFEVHQKRLGKIAFTLDAVAVTQDPETLGDYARQIRRWSLGLWQTVRRHRPKKNWFTVVAAVMFLQTIVASVLFLATWLALVALVVLVLAGPGVLTAPVLGPVESLVSAHLSLTTIALGVLAPEYAMTVLAALIDRRPQLLFWGVVFPLVRLLDAATALYTLPMAWRTRSDGRWTSPARRVMSADAGEVEHGAGLERAEPAASLPPGRSPVGAGQRVLDRSAASVPEVGRAFTTVAAAVHAGPRPSGMGRWTSEDVPAAVEDAAEQPYWPAPAPEDWPPGYAGPPPEDDLDHTTELAGGAATCEDPSHATDRVGHLTERARQDYGPVP